MTANKIKKVGSSLVTISDILVNEIQLTKLKNIAYARSVSNDLVDLMSENDDSADVWQMLERNFRSDDQVQTFMLFLQLHYLKMMEGGWIT